MISIIICSIDPRKFEKVCANYARLMGEEPHEIIGIHDARSLSEGYNRGIRQSSGSILIFSHDDIEILNPDFAARIKRHLQEVDIVGPAGTSLLVDGFWARAGVPYLHGQISVPKPDGTGYHVAVYDEGLAARENRTLTTGIQALDGVFFAVRRTVTDRLLFDDATFDRFHGYDVDFTYSAFLAGFRLGACNDIAIVHESQGNFKVEWEVYNQRFIRKHAGTLPDRHALGLMSRYWMVKECADKDALLRAFDLRAQRAFAGRGDSVDEAVGPESTSLLERCWRLLRSGIFGRQ